MVIVRSQNREVLSKVSHLEIHDEWWDEESKRHVNAIIDTRNRYEFILGEYVTKERALEVLDMIQKRIDDIGLASVSGNFMNFTFEMPAE